MAASLAELMQAVRHDDVKAALALLDASPGLVETSIHAAAVVADEARVRALLAQDAALATLAIGDDATPPLVLAVQSALARARGVSEDTQARVVSALIDAGADPNSSVGLADVHGRIPVLYFPCVAGNVPVARVLLERGASPTDGESLYHAAQYNRRAILELLLAHGANLSEGPAGTGNTPLHFLASHRASNALAPHVIAGMQWLLEHGADPRVPLVVIGDAQHPSQQGETPLHRAAANGYGVDVLAMFVAHGAAVDERRDDGATPYALAIRAANRDGALWLEEQGADVTCVSAMDRLLGACLSADEQTAQHIAQEHPTLIPSLTGSDAGALLTALVDGRDDAVRVMLALQWPLAHESEWGGTALHWAAWNGRTEMVRQLLEHGAPVNVRDSRYGSSPLAWTAHGSRYCARANDEDYPAIAHLLLDAGSTRAEAINQWGEPPESLGRPSVVAVLQQRGFAPSEGG